MEEIFFIAGGYYSAVNIFAFALFAYDKWCAQHDRWRIRESTLLFWAAIGGGLGAFLAMLILHHKTLHLKFKLLVPIFLWLHIFLIAIILINPGNFLEKIFSQIQLR